MPAGDGLPDLTAELDLLVSAAEAAGVLALRYFRNAPRTWSKANDSPVSEADLAVEEMLAERLRVARPAYGWLSEERADDGSRLGAPRTFIVDPIDGTREFIAGGPGWTIPLALVEAGRPVAAVTLAPARRELYTSALGGGAFLDGRRLSGSGRQRLAGGRVSGPRRLLRSPPVAPELALEVTTHASLAYRFAQVADGRLDGAIAKPNAQDWDVAAADLLVHESGGRVSGLDGAMLRYDRPTTAHPWIVAAAAAVHDELARTVAGAIAALAPVPGETADALAGAAPHGSRA